MMLLGLGLWGSLAWQAWHGRAVSVAWQEDEADDPNHPQSKKLAPLRDALRGGDTEAMRRELDKFLPRPEQERTWPAQVKLLADDDSARREEGRARLEDACPAALGFIRRSRSMENDLTARATLDALMDSAPSQAMARALVQVIRQADRTAKTDQASARELFWRLVPLAPDATVEEMLAGEITEDLATAEGLQAARNRLTDTDPARREMALRLLHAKVVLADDLLARLVTDRDPAVSLRALVARMDRGKAPAPGELTAGLTDAPAPLCRLAEARLLAWANEGEAIATWSGDTRQPAATGWAHWLEHPGVQRGPPPLARPADLVLAAQLNSDQHETLLIAVDRTGRIRERLATDGEVVACGFDSEGRAWLARSTAVAGTITWPFAIGDEKPPSLTVEGRLVALNSRPGGGFLAATRNELLLLEKGERKPLHHFGRRVVSAACLARDGWFAIWLDDGTVSWHDATGQPMTTFRIPVPQVVGIGMQVLPGRRILAPLAGENRVAEYDRTGMEVRSIAAPSPLAALRLPDGNTLVATPEGVLEFDTTDKPIRRQTVDWLPVALGVRMTALK